jgi:hypothetical protein
VVLEGFAAVDEDHRHFIRELPAKVLVGIDVDFFPGESALALQFFKAFFNYLAEVTSLSGVNYYFARLRHARQCNGFLEVFP